MRITNDYFKNIADYCSETYGSDTDINERYFVCPDCGEPIYDRDFSIDDFFADGPFGNAYCPVCGFKIYNIFIEQEPIDITI